MDMGKSSDDQAGKVSRPELNLLLRPVILTPDLQQQGRRLQRLALLHLRRGIEAERNGDMAHAMDCYRKGIAAACDAAPLLVSQAQRYDRVPCLYNRLSLVLERSRRDEEALAVIREFEALSIDFVPRREAEALHRRQTRLLRRLGCA